MASTLYSELPPIAGTTVGPHTDDPWTLDPLTGRLQIWQRKKGHRYSLDDVLTARETVRHHASPDRYLDLGCGIGSVLLMVADRLQANHISAVEAQSLSYGMALRNVARSGHEIDVHHGDLRDPDVQARLGGPFDLISGTPPYSPLGTATPSPDSQRAHARVEMRGGIEAYLDAVEQLLAPLGHAIICAAGPTERIHKAAESASLQIVHQVNAIPREGRPPLFHVWHLRRLGMLPQTAPSLSTFVARGAAGERTAEYIELRRFFGLPKTNPQ